ncbi:uncharacterized damage-inducible protein DinB [Ureibacillus xyleni]|uniref:Uncharacterized damage-inducible protein DinB n=1 Tax=Ureibacillus xyleni TaxID=614648 RepID=A0A285SXK4_9BACL|nr:DinB family protein [Ureibacillus xyleni]SOC13405.1 uncharacterized damage-inducible protein DinB [Ureibacillus xyleni]
MKTIQKMYDHLHWANQRILETLQSSENEEALRLFSHILFAEKVWFTRLQGFDSSHLPIWSDIDLEGCTELVKQNEETIITFLKDADLNKIIFYKNSKGTEFENSARDVLTHVALHGQYHRGQINSRLRASGMEPVNVDYITFVR